jgi:hypothetical protein
MKSRLGLQESLYRIECGLCSGQNSWGGRAATNEGAAAPKGKLLPFVAGILAEKPRFHCEYWRGRSNNEH